MSQLCLCKFTAPAVHTIGRALLLFPMMLKLALCCCNLQFHPLTILAQMLYLLLNPRHFRIGGIQIPLRLVQAIAGSVMLGTFFFQPFFRIAQACCLSFQFNF